MEQKVLCFEYMMFLLIQWAEKKDPKGIHVESFTRLKALKLLFLVSAVDATKDNEGLLDIFDNFYAMQHGPVESDIYNAMLLKNTRMYVFEGNTTTIQNHNLDIFDNVSDDLKYRIENSVNLLRAKNEQIIWCSPFELVNITHKWNSWREAINFAHVLDKKSEFMSVESIKNDSKLFS